MKRRRHKVEIPDELWAEIAENPQVLFRHLIDMEAEPPQGAERMMLCLKTTAPRLEIRYYRDDEQFLLDYTKQIIRDREEWEFHAFRLAEDEVWEIFLPPPVVGLGIRTRLRPAAYM